MVSLSCNFQLKIDLIRGNNEENMNLSPVCFPGQQNAHEMRHVLLNYHERFSNETLMGHWTDDKSLHVEWEWSVVTVPADCRKSVGFVNSSGFYFYC